MGLGDTVRSASDLATEDHRCCATAHRYLSLTGALDRIVRLEKGRAPIGGSELGYSLVQPPALIARPQSMR